MINGVMHIVAAVLFAMVYLFGNMGVLWLWIAGAYLILGISNLVVFSIRSSRKQKGNAKKMEVTKKEEPAVN